MTEWRIEYGLRDGYESQYQVYTDEVPGKLHRLIWAHEDDLTHLTVIPIEEASA